MSAQGKTEHVVFNEEHNTYGKRMTALTMQKAKEMMLNRASSGGTLPQTTAFKEVITEEINRRLLLLCNFV